MSESALSDESPPEAIARSGAFGARAERLDGAVREQLASKAIHIRALTGLRGYAALWVLLFHASFTDQLVWQLGARAHAPYVDAIVTHAYLAVDLFFMLSGFVLTHVHAEELDDNVGRRVYGRFLLLRLARVYPLHLFALLMTAAAQAFTVVPRPEDTIHTFLGQVFLTSSWGFSYNVNWNLPAWSLSSEWMAYLLFPLITMATASVRKVRWQLVGFALLGLVFFYLMFCLPIRPRYDFATGAEIRVLVGAAMGSLLRRLYDATELKRVPWGAVFWVGLPLALLTMTMLDGTRRPDNIWAWLSMAALLFAAAKARDTWMLPFTSRFPVYLGEISYAVYILHFPVLRAIRVLLQPELMRVAAMPSDRVALGVFFAVLLVVVLFSALAHTYVEVPARNWARRHIDRIGA
jgi:peptidoglycan/LPS O-acetylase OafA/YrhL